MKWTKTTIAASAVILIAGTAILMTRKHASEQQVKSQPQEIAAAADRIRQVNVNYPDTMVEAKTLMFAALIQRKIPEATNWCERLNAGKKLWPVTPTNIVFALNSRMAGRVPARGMRGDVVVFFEADNPGWNQVGGPELLSKKADGVAVAYMDGRAMIVPAGEVGKLRWAP